MEPVHLPLAFCCPVGFSLSKAARVFPWYKGIVSSLLTNWAIPALTGWARHELCLGPAGKNESQLTQQALQYINKTRCQGEETHESCQGCGASCDGAALICPTQVWARKSTCHRSPAQSPAWHRQHTSGCSRMGFLLLPTQSPAWHSQLGMGMGMEWIPGQILLPSRGSCRAQTAPRRRHCPGTSARPFCRTHHPDPGLQGTILLDHVGFSVCTSLNPFKSKKISVYRPQQLCPYIK